MRSHDANSPLDPMPERIGRFGSAGQPCPATPSRGRRFGVNSRRPRFATLDAGGMDALSRANPRHRGSEPDAVGHAHPTGSALSVSNATDPGQGSPLADVELRALFEAPVESPLVLALRQLGLVLLESGLDRHPGWILGELSAYEAKVSDRTILSDVLKDVQALVEHALCPQAEPLVRLMAVRLLERGRADTTTTLDDSGVSSVAHDLVREAVDRQGLEQAAGLLALVSGTTRGEAYRRLMDGPTDKKGVA